MISKHKYDNGVLYLYFDYSYEFGKFNIKKTSKNYIDTIIDYINKINYKGNKVIVMVGSIIVVTLLLSGNKITKIYDPVESNNTVNEEISYNQDSFDYTIDKNDESSNIDENTSNEDIPSTDKDTTNVNQSNEKSINIEKTLEEVNSNDDTKDLNNNIEEPSKNYITIIYNNVALSIDFEDYIIGVVAAEMPASFNIEALKAQSVIARTYALNLINNGRTLTSDNSTQNYIDINSMKSKWGNDFDKYYNKIKDAVNETKGITIKYNQELIDCVYHSTNNGYTEDSINVWGNDIPYLKSVESPWDKNASSYLRTISISLEDFNLKLKTNIFSDNQINILSRNSSNRVDSIMIGDKVFSGKDFRTILGLRSTDFDISITDNLVNITTRGYGHGVGMSQYGANGMALDGYNYKQILSYYYRGVTIN